MKSNKTNGHFARRNFLGSIFAIGAYFFLRRNIYADDQTSGQTSAKGFVSHAEDGEFLYIGPRRAPVRIKIGKSTGASRLAMGTEEIVPDDLIPVHKHGHEDEIVFIHAGEGTMTLAEEEIPVKTGSTVYVPVGVWHGLKNTGTDKLTMLWIFSPSGFEDYFRDIGVKPGDKPLNLTDEEWHKVDAKHAITYKE